MLIHDFIFFFYVNSEFMLWEQKIVNNKYRITKYFKMLK